MKTVNKLNDLYSLELEIITIQYNHYYDLLNKYGPRDPEHRPEIQFAYFDGLRTMLENILFQYYTLTRAYHLTYDESKQVYTIVETKRL